MALPAIAKFVGFYLTYEELKQHNKTPFFYFLYRFYLTYEELKPGPVAIANIPNLGFYLTYEELKQTIQKAIDLLSTGILSYL